MVTIPDVDDNFSSTVVCAEANIGNKATNKAIINFFILFSLDAKV